MRHRLQVETEGPGRARLLLDGRDISHGVTDLVVRLGVGEVARAELDLVLLDTTRIDSPDTEITIPVSTHEVLVALGWTPPEGSG